MGAKDPVYILVTFLDTQKLGIGTLDSIALPGSFKKKVLAEKIKDVQEFISSKIKIGISWPVNGGEWNLPTTRRQTKGGELKILEGHVLSFADDKDAITASRDAIIQSRKPPPKPPVSHSYKKTVATVAALDDHPGAASNSADAGLSSERSTSNKQSFEPPVRPTPQGSLTQTVARKTAPSVPSSLPAENSKQPSKRSGQTNQTGSQELARLLNEDSEDEDQDFQPQTAHDSDVDMFTESLDSSDDDTRNPQPTFTELTPVQTPTSVTSVLMTPPQLVTPTQAKTGRPSASTPSQKTVSGNRTQGENVRKRLHNSPTRSPSACLVVNGETSGGSSASKQKKLQKHQELMRKLEASQKALEEESLDATNLESCSADQLIKMVQELKQEIIVNNRNFDYEREQFNYEFQAEKEKYQRELNEKDEEIFTLKEDNPAFLVQNLKEGLLALQALKENQSHGTSQSAISGSQQSTQLMKLDDGFETMIPKSFLRSAIAYGKSGKQTTNLNKMVAALMKGLWDRDFMASHSVSGRKSPTDKSGDAPKPALPSDAVHAIKAFCISFWKQHHNSDLSPSGVTASISAKLLREHTAKKNAEETADAGDV